MTTAFELIAEPRTDRGRGASRRLRRQGRLPAIIYGGGQEPTTVSLEQREVLLNLKNEAFYSHILQIKLGDQTEQAILRDLQRHPFKPQILHMDLQRVSADQKLRAHVPLHFINEESARGVKLQGGVVSHLRIEIEVTCLPKDLPEFIEVDLTDLGLGEAIHLSELKLPAGVEIVELAHGAEYDVPVVNIHGQKSTDETEVQAGGESAEGGTPPATPTK